MKEVPLTMTLRRGDLILRPPNRADASLVFSASRVPGFTDGMLWEPPNKIDEVETSLQRSIEAWKRSEDYSFTIFDRSLDESVGRISIRETERDKALSIGFWTHPKYQGRGYMTSSVAIILDFAFGYLQAFFSRSLLCDLEYGQSKGFGKERICV